MQNRVAKWVLLVSAGAFLVGCSTFNRDWDRMAGSPQQREGIEGRWDGKWSSEVTGHSGRLRCIVSKKAADSYLARFRARFGKVFNYEYAVPLKVEERNGTFAFQGEANLHWYAGGVYHYEGKATATNFFSSYHAKSDHGTFELGRP